VHQNYDLDCPDAECRHFPLYLEREVLLPRWRSRRAHNRRFLEAHGDCARRRRARRLSDRLADRFLNILEDFKFLPGGRIQAGVGTERNVTLFNCFVMGAIEDSIHSIFTALQDAAITMQQGGGGCCDFSTLRPQGVQARGVGSIASGPVSFMQVWGAMCRTILSTSARRGAMMATLRCDHPDIEAFIAAKQRAGQLRHFNLSVLITDAFMTAG
jgi:ribonucleoside-diphosphate reductase alpha chain